MPWREEPSSYYVWLSEVMLQQTQVATVIPYFERFVARFPSIASLAAADEEEILFLWEGLGYYRRARSLLAAAKKMVAEHSGEFPTQFGEVLALPGVGRYTAGAILSISQNQHAPILEANTKRLFARLLAMREPLNTSEAEKTLWAFAEEILPKKKPGLFNQALMELGSLVCTSRAPRCEVCPIAKYCEAFLQNLTLQVPVLPTKAKATPQTDLAVLVRKKNRFLLIKQENGGRWQGLWDFPRSTVASDHSVNKLTAAMRRSFCEQLPQATGITASLGEKFSQLQHSVTRYKITLLVYEGEFVSGRAKDSTQIRWVSAKELAEYPLSSTGRKIAEQL